MPEEGKSEPRKVDSQNRVALPREVMEALAVESGDYVGFEVEGRRAYLFRLDVRRQG